MSLDVYLKAVRPAEVFSANITHNLGAMAEAAGIYRHLWRPEEVGVPPLPGGLDPTAAQVYADWLEENGEPGAAAKLRGAFPLGAATARALVAPLREGLARLGADPEPFRRFNPRNGWGSYEDLLQFVGEYLAACEKHPDAGVSVSR